MAAISIAKLNEFLSRVCPDVWATFLAQRNVPTAERPVLRIDDPMSPSTGPSTPVYDTAYPAPSALYTRGTPWCFRTPNQAPRWRQITSDPKNPMTKASP
ncbi:unnamed protein product [Parnassius apollo]|uniref:(apollo) hypothetical protein n=1 Tax=Parnassius apollo TaxID=110799 RepID=A0A8S3XQF8_PARAO|nr:unnamed protein product [Parnassius apollo]